MSSLHKLDVKIFSAKVLQYWMISSRKIKLNPSWKFPRNWYVPLVLSERSWWAGFNGIYLVKFGFRMWDIDFSVIPATENSNKFQKNQVLEGKIPSTKFVIIFGDIIKWEGGLIQVTSNP